VGGPTTKDQALKALDVIARQGEAFDPQTPTGSHFERFLAIYRACPIDTAELTFPVRTNPSLAPGAPAQSAIADPVTRLWAQLFNVRYRILLTALMHSVAIPTTATGANQANLRRLLTRWVYDEMMHGTGSIRELAMKLAELPSRTAVATPVTTAGAPFGLPYSLSLPDLGPERWRLHRDLIDASQELIKQIRATPGNGDALLSGIEERDGRADTEGRRMEIELNKDGP
jgi:hypothetical protein